MLDNDGNGDSIHDIEIHLDFICRLICFPDRRNGLNQDSRRVFTGRQIGRFADHDPDSLMLTRFQADSARTEPHPIFSILALIFCN